MDNRYFDFSIQTVRVGTERSPRHSEASILQRRDGSLCHGWSALVIYYYELLNGENTYENHPV